MRENIQTAIEEALNSAPERKFIETVEFSFNLKDIDLKNPANRIQEEIRLPAGRGKPVKIAMFAGGEMATKARAAGINIIDPATIEDLGGNRQQARKLANSVDFFLAEIPHMGTVGRFLGVVLGPRGKMPRPVPPTLDPCNGCSRSEGHSDCTLTRQDDFSQPSRFSRAKSRRPNQQRNGNLDSSYRQARALSLIHI